MYAPWVIQKYCPTPKAEEVNYTSKTSELIKSSTGHCIFHGEGSNKNIEQLVLKASENNSRTYEVWVVSTFEKLFSWTIIREECRRMKRQNTIRGSHGCVQMQLTIIYGNFFGIELGLCSAAVSRKMFPLQSFQILIQENSNKNIHFDRDSRQSKFDAQRCCYGKCRVMHKNKL